ncbi:MAG: Na+/H+ antiporter NhaC family protein [Ignavibacterium sp.]|nr:Na+/H+ antiporter NhaC family protein [Ignavibacterium sp.]MCX7611677.1 Na+/H+ antiporter NhaC family protein [Ignavibacterium sp.]MDW8375857.1 Na+/H+ antiporter NhaC family protein [Ignavibacteriales bacterium]
MRNLLKFILLLILISTNIFSQNIEFHKIALTKIQFKVKIQESNDSLKASFISKDNSDTISFIIKPGIYEEKIIFKNSGNYDFYLNNVKTPKSVRVIPAILSVVPPLIAILIALIFRQVLFSLLIGIFSGALFINDYNIIVAFMRIVDEYIINSLTDKSHMQIIVFTLLFGGMVGLISKSGGTKGIANLLLPLAKNRRSGLFATWLSGLVIFFDDYANSLVVGNLMRPITDKLKISREKLAFIVDSTSAPVASIFLISSWIGYEVGLIQDALNSINSQLNAYSVFLESILFRFYPITMLIFILLTIYLGKDFGPMWKSEKLALMDERFTNHNSSSTDILKSSELMGNDDRAKWYNGVVPILIMLITAFIGLVFTGMDNINEKGITNFGFKEIIYHSDSFLSLLWASAFACLVAGVMYISQRIMKLSEVMDAWFLGLRSMFLAVLVLTLAWSIGTVTYDIKTADYIVSLVSDSISPYFLPVIVFLVCAITSFSTGTSWGTMAIMMPIVIKLSSSVSNLYNLSPADSHLILIGVISSVLAGCVFGDHCSPISDTTILSSMASSCDHIAHVRTQLPYAIVVALVCMLLGDIPTSFGFPPILSILIISIVLFLILKYFGKTVEE